MELEIDTETSELIIDTRISNLESNGNGCRGFFDFSGFDTFDITILGREFKLKVSTSIDSIIKLCPINISLEYFYYLIKENNYKIIINEIELSLIKFKDYINQLAEAYVHSYELLTIKKDLDKIKNELLNIQKMQTVQNEQLLGILKGTFVNFLLLLDPYLRVVFIFIFSIIIKLPIFGKLINKILCKFNLWEVFENKIPIKNS